MASGPEVRPTVARREVLLAGIAGSFGALLSARSGATDAMPNVILLGDSTLDNAAYVPAGQNVAEQLNGLLPAGWRATLLAVDGDLIGGVARQLERAPADASHLIVSVGGQRRAPLFQRAVGRGALGGEDA